MQGLAHAAVRQLQLSVHCCGLPLWAGGYREGESITLLPVLYLLGATTRQEHKTCSSTRPPMLTMALRAAGRDTSMRAPMISAACKPHDNVQLVDLGSVGVGAASALRRHWG
jgi:hypothetical protein